MSVDRYTKVVLTVIAVALVLIALRPITRVPVLYAIDGPQDGRVDVNLVAIDGFSFDPGQIDIRRPRLPVIN